MQVGCTINYGRKVLWKKWEKLRTISFWQKCGNSRPRLFVERSSTPLHSQLGTLFRDRLALTIWVRSARILKAVRNGQSVVSPNSGPVAQLGARFHGMEEVVGSIPTRSTKSLNNLDRETPRRHGVCVLVLVMTRRLGAHGKGFHRRPLRFHPHMALQTLQRFDKSNARNWILRLPRANFPLPRSSPLRDYSARGELYVGFNDHGDCRTRQPSHVDRTRHKLPDGEHKANIVESSAWPGILISVRRKRSGAARISRRLRATWRY